MISESGNQVMDFKGLMMFKTIYELKTLNKAAKYLNCTQSNLTAHLKKMEHEFGTVFFIRQHNGVKVTENGEKFYLFAIQTLSNIQNLKTVYASDKPKLLISELLFKFVIVENEKYSILSTHITVKKTSDMANEINHNYYDEVITFKPLDNKNYRLMNSNDLPACFLQGNITSDKSQLPILINSDILCPFRKLTLTLIQDTSKIIEIDSLENLLQLVTKGQGIALLPAFFIDNGYTSIDNKKYDIKYYNYKHQ
ncbi:LysR family transcriptional regulator [Orbaceae bacterium ac157xtp]